MKKLLDESGYVLVLRRPYLVVGDKEAIRSDSTPQVLQAPATPVASCSVPHCNFICGWCGGAIRLPNDRIGSPFGSPDARKIDVRSIATVCHTCRHLSNYTMFRGCRGFDTRHKLVHAPNDGRTALLNWLCCNEKTCTARVPLFVRFSEPEQEMMAPSWLWEDLTCALNHPIREIPLDPSLELPLRTFAELK
jgi:hypothetical protein